MNEAPAGFAVKKMRVGIYEPWAGNIDEGWTKWILEQYHFPFTVLHNQDVQAGHLRSKFDSIVLAEMAARQIVDGMAPGTVPGQYAGGIGDDGVEMLREFVNEGGTLVTLGNASQFAIDRFSLPVKNIVAGLRSDEFFCSGALLRADVKEHPVTAGTAFAGRSSVRAQRGVRNAARLQRKRPGELHFESQSAAQWFPDWRG